MVVSADGGRHHVGSLDTDRASGLGFFFSKLKVRSLGSRASGAGCIDFCELAEYVLFYCLKSYVA